MTEPSPAFQCLVRYHRGKSQHLARMPPTGYVDSSLTAGGVGGCMASDQEAVQYRKFLITSAYAVRVSIFRRTGGTYGRA